jgi:hypothetical protein
MVRLPNREEMRLLEEYTGLKSILIRVGDFASCGVVMALWELARMWLG